MTAKNEDVAAAQPGTSPPPAIADRLQRLQSASIALGRAPDEKSIAQVVIDHALGVVGAKTGGLFLVTRDGAHAEIVASHGYPAGALEKFSLLPLDGDIPLVVAIRTRTSIFLESREEYAARFRDSEARTRGLSPASPHAIACVPVMVADTCYGGLAFAFEGERRFTDDERRFLDLLAHQCALAFDRVRRLHRVQAAATRLELLADASRAFASAQSDLKSVLETIASYVTDRIGDSCSVLLVSEDGLYIMPMAIRHRDPIVEEATRATLSTKPVRIGESRPGEVAKTGIAMRIAHVSPIKSANPEYQKHLDRFPIHSLLIVPIKHQGRILGVIVLSRSTPEHPYEAEDESLLADIADRAGLAIAHAKAYEALEEASRLKDEFLATVSHELRTPLSAILGWASMLSMRTDQETLKAGLGAIERNARSQVRIVEDILDVSRIVRGELRLDTNTIDLQAIAADVVESLAPAAAARKIDVVLAPSEDEHRLIADPERVRQILWNLLSNAVKFTASGGHVTITLSKEAGNAVITVQDDGQGIDASFLPFVFERFRQADGSATRHVGGLGLGLAIVRHLTELHGGSVRAESEGLGKGAKFVVTLPIRPFVTPAQRLPTAKRRVLDGFKLLVVEDDEDSRSLIELLLQGEGAEVMTSPSAVDALAMLETKEIDLLLSDIGLPTHDGYWLIRNVRERWPALPAIALTALTRAEDARDAQRAGFTHFIGKPVEPQTLIDLIASSRSSTVE